MSYEIDVLITTDRAVPSADELKEAVLSMPNIEEGHPSKGSLWQYDYLNPDTSVSFAFKYQNPTTECIQQRAWDTGLQIVIPTVCPTFVARESFPIVEQFAKKFHLSLYLPSGEILDTCEASQLQTTWTDINRKAIMRLGNQPNIKQPFYFPQEQLDEMWRYLSSRPLLLKRYSPLSVYVPRVLLMRNKLNRRIIYRTAMWADLAPSVIPDVDAFIINKPQKLLFNMFPRGEMTPVFVHYDLVEDIISPYIREANRPITHKLLENTSAVKLPIYRKLLDKLNFLLHDYETAYIEEIVDVATY